MLARTPRSPAQPPRTIADRTAADPLAGGALGLITRDLVCRAGAHSGLLAVWSRDDNALRISFQGAALVLTERLRSTISTTTLNGAHEPLGASAGVAQSRTGCTAEDLLAAADEALRTAKRAGGGLVVGPSDVAAGAGRGVACQDQRRQHRTTAATPLRP